MAERPVPYMCIGAMIGTWLALQTQNELVKWSAIGFMVYCLLDWLWTLWRYERHLANLRKVGKKK